MTFTYIFDTTGIEEYEQAVYWYREHSVSAMNNFIKAVDGKIKDICTAPTLYRNTYRKYRETQLSKFPYSIVYLVDEQTRIVTITSIYHHKRNPKRKYKK